MPHINVKLSHDWCLPAMSSTGAAKKDSAVVIQDLWDQRILLPFPHVTPQSLNQFRRLLMTKLYVKLCKEFKKYICEKYFNGSIEGTIYNRGGNSGNSWGDECEFGDKQQMKTLSTDIQAGRSVLSAYLNNSYMTWNKGSALIFWRWPTTLQTIARDGFPPKLLHNLPTNLKRPHAMKEDDRLKLLEKLSTCLSKGYLRLVPASNVKSYIDIFGVPKGPDDIRMVLNGASCGINESLFSSNFWLPMSNTMTRLLSFGYRAVDVDLGEMFLNFPLDHVLQGYSGIDLSMFRKELSHQIPTTLEKDNRLSAIWTRSWFGLKSSPEVAITYYHLAEEFVRGKQDDLDNPLRWDEIKLNMIGEEEFNPSFPNVYKWDARKN